MKEHPASLQPVDLERPSSAKSSGPTPWPMPQSQEGQQPMDLTTLPTGRNVITLQERTVTVTPQEELDPTVIAQIQQKMAEQMQATEHAIREEFGHALFFLYNCKR